MDTHSMVGMTSTGVVWCSRLAYVGDADFLLYRVKDGGVRISVFKAG
ncbi:hypothetical protein KTD13_20465 [Burkholderia multivorans]|nr:hypothetical protein [Burkholderia multivorans]